ncbi:hypothetical protein CDG81_22100 [Actinopolyspora erythraea]|uniref:PE domain-containing protein n=1 Tax=Actinopolyspora erythraea TaxID=414996 RepID=A0A099D9F3_9ACTN|nr:hypothetical protein [Actinopolyspora erythraea]ASU80521.1 hypothetical protein CDG81_22100 [Actinopolyspora erythraea]KGI82808.1 hypothetical protein IL38_02750 [Actinopolyspora erythraea]
MSQDGFGVDYDKLREAIKELIAARDEAGYLEQQAGVITPGELTAMDGTTERAREAFQQRMTGDEGSLRSAARDIRKILQEKIEAYNAVLNEYGLAEENASVAQRDAERRS